MPQCARAAEGDPPPHLSQPRPGTQCVGYLVIVHDLNAAALEHADARVRGAEIDTDDCAEAVILRDRARDERERWTSATIGAQRGARVSRASREGLRGSWHCARPERATRAARHVPRISCRANMLCRGSETSSGHEHSVRDLGDGLEQSGHAAAKE